MALTYGFIKCKVASNPRLHASHQRRETQYHLHAALHVGGTRWDTAINVGTDDADDLLNYRLVFDYHHPLVDTLQAARPGFHDLTGTAALPALDFLRSDVLKETGSWRESEVMDGTEHVEPLATLQRLLQRAHDKNWDVYIFGRAYKDGKHGIHDVHMNQGSQTERFFNDGVHDHNDHNDVWQDGAVFVDLGAARWAGYFTAFTQQLAPTDTRGNPRPGSHPIDDADAGSLAVD